MATQPANSTIDSHRLFERFQELQNYVGWSDQDARLVSMLGSILEPHIESLVDDFYDEIQQHPAAFRVITGGQQQIDRLKQSLKSWVRDLLSGVYDVHYVRRRWQIGYRHVEIGLDQVYTNAALSRLRRGLTQALQRSWQGSAEELFQSCIALNTLLDLDLALIEDAYQTEFTLRREAAERFSLIGQVAGGIAHELRNPLNVIQTSVFYLMNVRHPTEEKTNKHLKRIEKQVGLADQVITSLTNFAKMTLPEIEPIGVEQYLRSVLQETSIPENIDVTINTPSNLPKVLADPGQLRIVLGNLIRNAFDAMPQGGRLRLSAKHSPPHVAISVADTGNGIDPILLDRIMEPFYSTKARGIGLGLAMAKAIGEKNAGLLQVESELGTGTTFTLRLREAAGTSEPATD